MRFLLRLFPAYRALELKLADAASARIDAEDAARLALDRANRAETALAESSERERRTLYKFSNWQALATGCRVMPFPEEYTPPPVEEPAQGGPMEAPRPKTMRDVETERNRQARAKADEARKRALGIVQENIDKAG